MQDQPTTTMTLAEFARAQRVLPRAHLRAFDRWLRRSNSGALPSLHVEEWTKRAEQFKARPIGR